MSEITRAISRRKFGQSALIGAALPGIASTPLAIASTPLAIASTPLAIAATPPAIAATPQQQGGAGLSEAENAEVEARYANTIRQYGDRLNEEQRQRIRRVLAANERMMSHIREFPLDNGDTPATVLKIEGGK